MDEHENLQTNIEQFYEYLDQVATRLHAMDGTPYLSGLSLALEYLLDDTLGKNVPDVVEDDIANFKSQVVGIELKKESVRKGIQIALLKGFREMNITNAMMTPDTIGMFIGYMINKLYDGATKLKVFDPLVGTGNLIATLNNHYHTSLNYVGVDADPLLSELSRNFLDALDIDHQIYHANAIEFTGGPFDLIVTDFPVESVDRKHTYFPYQMILKHLENLTPQGFFLGIVENDFFDQNEADEFKSKLSESAHLYGLIKFDESLFTSHPKSLLIMQKKESSEDTIDDFLLADLPPFTDEERFNQALLKIDQWFKNKKG